MASRTNTLAVLAGLATVGVVGAGIAYVYLNSSPAEEGEEEEGQSPGPRPDTAQSAAVWQQELDAAAQEGTCTPATHTAKADGGQDTEQAPDVTIAVHATAANSEGQVSVPQSSAAPAPAAPDPGPPSPPEVAPVEAEQPCDRPEPSDSDRAAPAGPGPAAAASPPRRRSNLLWDAAAEEEEGEGATPQAAGRPRGPRETPLFRLSGTLGSGMGMRASSEGVEGGLGSPQQQPRRQRINSTRHKPSLRPETHDAASPLVAALKLHYPPPPADDGQAAPAPSLARRCALLCERHCPTLLDISGEFGETVALDLGCGPGGTTFELAVSFKHVLGIEWDPMMCAAAKQLKEAGGLEYAAEATGGGGEGGGNGEGGGEACARVSSGSSAAGSEPEGERRQQQEGVQEQPECSGSGGGAPEGQGPGGPLMCVARVPPDTDRDRVRFWAYELWPKLPPKLQPVDAILVADVQGRAPALARVLGGVPELLKARGVCVLVLGGGGAAGGGGQEGAEEGQEEAQEGEGEEELLFGAAQGLLGGLQGLRLLAEERVSYAAPGGGVAEAWAAVWQRVA